MYEEKSQRPAFHSRCAVLTSGLNLLSRKFHLSDYHGPYYPKAPEPCHLTQWDKKEESTRIRLFEQL